MYTDIHQVVVNVAESNTVIVCLNTRHLHNGE